MSTIKATNIQPQSDSDPLVFSTNATERMRIPSSGGVSITGGADVFGTLTINGKATSTGTTGTDSATTLTTKSYVDDMQRIGATRHLAVFTNTSSAISSIVGYNSTAAFTITSVGGSLNVLIPSGFGTWHILVAIYNTSSGALNALTVATVTSGINTSIASLTNTSPSGQSIMLSCTRHS